MSEPRDIHNWDRRYGGTIYHPQHGQPERSHRGLWIALGVAAAALCLLAAWLGVAP